MCHVCYVGCNKLHKSHEKHDKMKSILHSFNDVLDLNIKVIIWIPTPPLYSAANTLQTPVSTFWNVVDVTSSVALRKATRAHNPSSFSGGGIHKVPEIKACFCCWGSKSSCRI